MNILIQRLESRLHFSTYQPDVGFGSLGATRLPLNQPAMVKQFANGTILVVGNAIKGSPRHVVLARYTAGGSLDPTFGDGGIVVTSTVGTCLSAAAKENGSLVLLVQQQNDVNVVRLKPSGSRDPLFHGNGLVTVLTGQKPMEAGQIAFNNAGAIVATGFTGGNNAPFLFQLTSSGHLDPTFSSDGNAAVPFRPYALAIQNDGKIIVAGYINKAARYNTDGTLDDNFAENGVFTGDAAVQYVYTDIAIDNDGSLVLGGSVHGSFNGSSLIRLDAAGTLETAFPITNSGSDTFEDVRIDPENEQVIAVTDETVQRFSTDGTVDDPGTTAGAALRSLQVSGQTAELDAVGNLLVASSAFSPTIPMLLRFTSAPRPAATLGDNGTLLITGTRSADTIGITIQKKLVRLRMNSVISLFSVASVKQLDIQAQDGNDVIDWSGTSIPARCDAGAGNDFVTAGDGGDYVIAGAGRDTVFGGGGDDRLNGNGSADQLFGQAGDDNLRGGDGDDTLDGGAGRDTINGDLGTDSLNGGGGSDRLYP